MTTTTSGFDGRHFEFRWSANVGQSRQSHIHVRHGQKCEGGWNRGFTSQRSKVISTSGLMTAILKFGNEPT
jgi:hypothetical protein